MTIEVRTMTETDRQGYAGASDFEDGTPPLMATSDFAEAVASGDHEGLPSVNVNIASGDRFEIWVKSFESKDAAVSVLHCLVAVMEVGDADGLRKVVRDGYGAEMVGWC